MLSVWTAVLDIKAETSPSRRVVPGLSWGSPAFSINIQEPASQDTAGEASGTWSVLVKSFQFWLLLDSVVATTKVEASGSVDRLMSSSDPLLVSVKVCVCSVSVEKEKRK